MDKNELNSLQVYLIEPSNTQQHIICQYLAKEGIVDVKTIGTGQEALVLFNSRLPDIVISSMYLPDMTGVELLHKIRKNHDSYESAFILISSETNIKYLEPIRQAGAIAILPKPFSIIELRSALASTLQYLNPEKIILKHFDIADLQVLVVDDSELSQKLIVRILRNIGIENISTAHNGKQGWDIFNQHYFDLVLTDFNMPEMDGLELVQRIRADKEKSVPILMLTSEQSQSRLAAIENAGVSALLDKPFEPDFIKKLIINLLS